MAVESPQTEVEHRIVNSEIVGSQTGQILYTCACGWYGRWWNGHAIETGAKQLPPEPSRGLSRDALRRAIYGDRQTSYGGRRGWRR